MPDLSQAFGWHYRPEAVEAILAGLPMPTMQEAAPDLTTADAPEDVLAWDFEEKVLGRILDPWDQNPAGTCVSFGWAHATQDTLLAQIVTGTRDGWPGAEVATEPIYALSRVEVGGGQIRGDGSVGAWAAEAVSKWGVLLRKRYTDAQGRTLADLSRYSADLSRDWGRRGLPDELEPVAREHPVRTVTLVETPEDCERLLRNLYFVAICGQLGRTMKRQPGGWCRIEGRWAHCQELCGRVLVKDGPSGTPAFVYRNSWGGYLGTQNARVALHSGREITLPPDCYLSRYEEVARDLRLRDTFALSDVEGFKSRKIPHIF